MFTSDFAEQSAVFSKVHFVAKSTSRVSKSCSAIQKNWRSRHDELNKKSDVLFNLFKCLGPDFGRCSSRRKKKPIADEVRRRRSQIVKLYNKYCLLLLFIPFTTFYACGAKVNFSGLNANTVMTKPNTQKENNPNSTDQMIQKADSDLKSWTQSFQLGDYDISSELLSVPSEALQVVTFQQLVDAPRTQYLALGEYAHEGSISVERIKRIESNLNTVESVPATRPIDVFVTISNRTNTTAHVRSRTKDAVRRVIERLYDQTSKLNIFLSGLYDSNGVAQKRAIIKTSQKSSSQALAEVDSLVDSIFANPTESNKIFNSQYKLQTYAETPPNGPQAQSQWNGSRLFLILTDQSNCTLVDGSPDPSCTSTSGIHTFSGLQNLGTGAEPNDLYMPVHAVFAASFPVTRTCTSGNPDNSPLNQFEAQALRSEKFKHSSVNEVMIGDKTNYISDICSNSSDNSWIDNATRDVLEIAKNRRNIWQDYVDSMPSPNEDLNLKVYSIGPDGAIGWELVRNRDYFLPNRFPALSPKLPKGLYKLVYHMTYDPSKNNLVLPALSYDLPTKVDVTDTSFELSYSSQKWICPVQSNFEPDAFCRIHKGSGTTPDKIYFKNLSIFPTKINSGVNEVLRFKHGKSAYELTLPNARQILNVARNNVAEPNTIERLSNGLKVKLLPSAADGIIAISYLNDEQVQSDFLLPVLPANNIVSCYKGILPENKFQVHNHSEFQIPQAELIPRCTIENDKLKLTELVPLSDGQRNFTVVYKASLLPRSDFRLANEPIGSHIEILNDQKNFINEFKLMGNRILLNTPLTQGHSLMVKYRTLKDSSRCVNLSTNTPVDFKVFIDDQELLKSMYTVKENMLCVEKTSFKPAARLYLK